MADVFTPEKRSAVMARIGGRDTKPELAVRALLRRLGVRWRSQAARLPGRPDVVVPAARTAIFVHGCFWHGHEGCPKFKVPATRREFWLAKITANRRRDARTSAALRRMGWRVLTVWACRLSRPDRVSARLARELGVPLPAPPVVRTGPPLRRRKASSA